MAHWLRLCASNAGVAGSIPGLRSHVAAMQPKKKAITSESRGGLWRDGLSGRAGKLRQRLDAQLPGP